jgi:hypothetical protein
MGLHASQARPGSAEPWPLGPDPNAWHHHAADGVLPAGWLLMAF